MSAIALIKILLFGAKLFVILLLLFGAVYLAVGLASLAIVGPPTLALLGFKKALDMMQKGLIWILVRVGLVDTQHGPEEEGTATSTGSQREDSSPPPPPEMEEDPYSILGVPHGASQDEIVQAYRQKMLKNHPDKVAHLDPVFSRLANERAITLQRAFEALVRAA